MTDPELDGRLRTACARFFRGLRGAGYGRCDLRVDRDGRPFMLEINPNCGLYYPLDAPSSADLILQHDPAGHAGFTRLVVDAALARHARRQRAWEVRSRAQGDYGLFATRDLRAGGLHPGVGGAGPSSGDRRARGGAMGRAGARLVRSLRVADQRGRLGHLERRPGGLAAAQPLLRADGVAAGSRRGRAPPAAARRRDHARLRDLLQRAAARLRVRLWQPDCRGTVRGQDHLQPFLARYEARLRLRPPQARVVLYGQERSAAD